VIKNNPNRSQPFLFDIQENKKDTMTTQGFYSLSHLLQTCKAHHHMATRLNGDDNKADEPLCPICQDPVGTHGGIIECCPYKHQMCNTCAKRYLINNTSLIELCPCIQSHVECPYKCGHNVAARIKETLPHLTTSTKTLTYFDLLPGESDKRYTVEMEIRWNHKHEHDVLNHGKTLENAVVLRSLMSNVCGFMMSGEETEEATRMDFTHVIRGDKVEQGWTSGKKGVIV
jgi:hypothetical protein